MPEKHCDASFNSLYSFTLPFAYCRLFHCILFPAIRILFFLPIVISGNRPQKASEWGRDICFF